MTRSPILLTKGRWGACGFSKAFDTASRSILLGNLSCTQVDKHIVQLGRAGSQVGIIV